MIWIGVGVVAVIVVIIAVVLFKKKKSSQTSTTATSTTSPTSPTTAVVSRDPVSTPDIILENATPYKVNVPEGYAVDLFCPPVEALSRLDFNLVAEPLTVATPNIPFHFSCRAYENKLHFNCRSDGTWLKPEYPEKDVASYILPSQPVVFRVIIKGTTIGLFINDKFYASYVTAAPAPITGLMFRSFEQFNSLKAKIYRAA